MLQRRRLFVLAAASLVAALGLWSLLAHRETQTGPLDTLALLALNDHLDTSTLDVRSDDVAAGHDRPRDRIPFEIRMPELGEGIHVE